MFYDLELTTPCWSATSSLLHISILGGGQGRLNPHPLNTPMKHSCYYLKELVKSAIIPIPKDKSVSLSKSTNYIIIDLCGGTLSTSYMQFGYKPNYSTTSSTTVLKDKIKYYLRGNSNVYCCLLDASKAFDKIYFGKLFKTLISMNLQLHLI